MPYVQFQRRFHHLAPAILCSILILSALASPTQAARRVGDLPAAGDRRAEIGSPLIRRAQEVLSKFKYYHGPLDGRMSESLRRAIRDYQRHVGRKVNGKVSEELVTHIETQTKIGAMMRHLQRVKKENIEAARKALLGKAETRHLVTASKPDEIADPTRDASDCFRRPGQQCLLQEAVESAKAIHRRELRDWAFGEILVAQTKSGLAESAISTMQRIGDARLIIVALRDMARAQARAGRIAEAEAVADIIPDPFKRLEALSAIAHIQLKNKAGDGAHRMAARVITLSRKLASPLQRVTLLAQMAVVLNKVGEIKGAERALDEAYALARSDDLVGQLGRLEKGAALRHVASALAEVGQPMRAIEIIEDITGIYDRTAVLMSAALAQAQAGDTKQAWKTANKISASRYRTVVLGRIAVAQARAGQPATAAATIDLALATTEKIKLPYARSYAIGQLVQALIEIGLESGREALAEAAMTAMEIDNDRLRAYTLWTAAAAQKRKGYGEDFRKTEALAVQATKQIGSSLSQVWLYGDIASESAEAGQKELARMAFRKGVAIAENIHNAWGRARALAKLAATLQDLE